MLGGIGPWHIRVLTDDPWLGGMGHPLQEVANWTLDQILFALGERKHYLKRRRSVAPTEATGMTDEKGLIRGRAADGTPIRGRIVGKSLARQLIEEAEAEAERKRQDGRRRKKRRASNKVS